MIAHWPTALPQKPRRGTWNGGPRDFRRRFQPEIGPPIFRRGSTAEVMAYQQVVFPNIDAAQRSAWETFYNDTLAGGTQPFSWRDPDTDVPGLWIIEGGDLGYSMLNRGADLRDLTLNLIRRPGTPWWSTLLPAGRNQVPVLALDFLGQLYGRDGVRQGLSSLVNFTRGSTATYVGTDGLIKSAVVNEPRVGANGLLLEGSRTNLALRSQEFDNATWAKSEMTVTANAGLAPDGSVSADLIVPSVNNLDHRVRQTIAGIVSGTTYVPSVFLKRGGYSWARVSIGTSFATNYIFVNLLTGAVGLNTGVTNIAVEAFQNDWWRVSGSVVANASGNGVLDVFALSGNTFTTFAGNGTGGILAWGAQLEAGSGLTSYIPTTAAAVTRAADVISLVSAESGVDLRVVQRDGTVVDALSQSLSAGSWPTAAAAGARQVLAYPAGALAA